MPGEKTRLGEINLRANGRMFLTATTQLCSAPAVAKVYRWFWSGLCTQSWVWLSGHWFWYLMGLIPTRQRLLSHPAKAGTLSGRAHSASVRPPLGNRHFLKEIPWISTCIWKGTALDHLINSETHWDCARSHKEQIMGKISQMHTLSWQRPPSTFLGDVPLPSLISLVLRKKNTMTKYVLIFKPMGKRRRI